MSYNPLSRRAFLAAGAAGATALAAMLAGCGSAQSGGGSSDATGSSGNAGNSGETSFDATATDLELVETSGQIAYALNCRLGDLTPWGPDAVMAACVNFPVLEGLYEIDPVTFDAYPALAAGTPKKVTKNVFEIKLREYPLFSDGTPVTADDVVASFEQARKSAYGAFSELLSFIAEVEATGDTTVTVVTKVAMDDLLEKRLSLVKVVPADVTAAQLKAGAMGTGPWKLKSVDAERAVYERNTYYTGDCPAMVDNLTCNFSVDAAARVNAVASGSVQAIEDAPIGDETLNGSKAIEVASIAGFNPALLVFNTRKAPFDDRRVRQAILYAAGADDLAKSVFAGNAVSASCFLNETNPGYQKAEHVYNTSTERARDLLEGAEVSELEFVLDTGQDPWMEPAARMIAESLAKVGMTVEVHTFPLDELYATYMDTSADVQPFSVALTTFDPTLLGNDPDLVVRWFFSNKTWMEKRTGWSTSSAYKQLQELLTTTASAEKKDRDTAWKNVFNMIADQVPLYPLLHCSKTTAYRPAELSGFEPIATTGIDMLNTSVPE